MTRYYVDNEFIEDGNTIDLVSIGVVCEDGREFYRENSEADLTKASPWVTENVVPHLQGGGIPHEAIRDELQEFVAAGEDAPEFWGWYSDYDWVVVAQLFGPMVDLPEGWPMRCNDLQQLADALGVTALPPQTGTVHNALADARWNRAVHEHLLALPACTHSRVEALDLLAGHRAGKTPRIDTMRNRLHATLQLLGMVGEELDDLQVLAYDRRVAAEDVKVAGGQRDYALDTNGDPAARDAYRGLALAQADMFDIAAEAAHDVITVLRRGERTAPRGPRMIQAIDLAEAIAQQAKRAAAGEYTPVAREPQPEADRAAAAVAELTRQRDDALKLVERQGKLVERLANHNPVARNEATGEYECRLCGAVNPRRPGHHAEDCLWRLARGRARK